MAYRGYRRRHETHVQKLPGGEPLRVGPSRELQTHSRSFEWGYNGSGPAQLALAILLDYIGDEDLALQCYQRFCRLVISELEAGDAGQWQLGAETIEETVTSIQEALADD